MIYYTILHISYSFQNNYCYYEIKLLNSKVLTSNKQVLTCKHIPNISVYTHLPSLFTMFVCSHSNSVIITPTEHDATAPINLSHFHFSTLEHVIFIRRMLESYGDFIGAIYRIDLASIRPNQPTYS